MKKKTILACRIRACRRPKYPGLDICRRHARAKADRLWSTLTPKTACEAQGKLGHVCGGSYVAGHGFSRVYSATRWDPLNRFVICSGLNWAIETNKGLEWEMFLSESWGRTVYEDMRKRAINDPEPDLVAVLADLTKRKEKAA